MTWSALLLSSVSLLYFLSLPSVTPSRMECFNSEQCDAQLPVRISADCSWFGRHHDFEEEYHRCERMKGQSLHGICVRCIH